MKNEIIRKCFGCKSLKPRENLIKITLLNGALIVNPESKQCGRSVYVCKNKDCIKSFIKNKGIRKGLKFNNDILIKKTEEKLLNFNVSN